MLGEWNILEWDVVEGNRLKWSVWGVEQSEVECGVEQSEVK